MLYALGNSGSVAARPLQACCTPKHPARSLKSRAGFSRKRVCPMSVCINIDRPHVPGSPSKPVGGRLAQGRKLSVLRAVGEVGSSKPSKKALGQICLVIVAALWGTYSPAVRLVYSQPGPPIPEVLTAIRAVLQACVLLAFVAGAPLVQRSGPTADKEHQHKSWPAKKPEKSLGAVGRALGVRSAQAFVVGGLELGLWNFCASGLQALSLELTTATRGAFLLQATALLTPLLATASGERLHPQVWGGCCLALAGTIIITLDQNGSGATSSQQHLQSLGDFAMLGSAFFYSLATVRLSGWASQADALPLATSKSISLAMCSVAYLLGYGLLHGAWSAEGLHELWPNPANSQAWTALAWTAIGPGAAAAWLSTQGQSRVPAAQAQVLFATVPLWAALFAWLSLSGETMSTSAWIGGSAILAASFVASNAPKA